MPGDVRSTLLTVDQAQRLALYDSIVAERDEYQRRVREAEEMLRTLAFACLPQEYDTLQRAQPDVVQEWVAGDYFLFLNGQLPPLLHELRALEASAAGRRARELQARLREYEAQVEALTRELACGREKLQAVEARWCQAQETQRQLGAALEEVRELRRQNAHLEARVAEYRQMVQDTLAAFRVTEPPSMRPGLPVLDEPQRRFLAVMGRQGLCRQRAIFRALLASGSPDGDLERLVQGLETLGLVTGTTVEMGRWRSEVVWQLTPAGRAAYLAGGEGADLAESEIETALLARPSLAEAVLSLDAADMLETHGVGRVERRPQPLTDGRTSYTPHLVAEVPGPGRVPILCLLQVPAEKRLLDAELDRYAAVCRHYYVVCPDNDVMRAAWTRIHEHRGPGSRRRMWLTHLVGLAHAPADELWKIENR